MPRRVGVRHPQQESPAGDGGARRAWVGRWKGWAIGQLPVDAPRSARVQLRVDIERALSRYGLDDDEDEIRDVVASLVEEATTRVEAKADDQARQRAKELIVNSASIYLVNSLLKIDRGRVASMLKRPESSMVVLTARLKGHLSHRLRGDENHAKIEGLVDAWVGRRLGEQPPPSEQPPASNGRLRGTLKAAGTIVGAAAVVGYQHPRVKAAVDSGVARAKQIIERLTPPPSSPPSQPGASDGLANR